MNATSDIEGPLHQLLHHESGHEDGDDEDGDRQRRAIAEAGIPEALEIDEITEHIGGTEGGTLGHHRDEIESAQRFEQGEHDDHRRYRPELGYGDLRQHAKMTGALDLGRVERFFRDIAEPGEIK